MPSFDLLLIRIRAEYREMPGLKLTLPQARRLWQLDPATYELVVLDVMMPGISGFDVCRQLRKLGSNIPILNLSARDMVADRVTGLDAGADDYLTKPFAFAELSARVRALVRRRQPAGLVP